jgi:hypothetical protein
LENFICEIIKPIKRRSSRTALNKNKSMNKVLSLHTCVEQCLYQFLRDGQCYNGKDPNSCKDLKKQANGIDLEKITTDLKDRLKDSIVLQYRDQAERNKVTTSTDTEEVFTGKVLFPPMDEDRKRVSPAGVVGYVWFDPELDRVTKTKRVKVETHGTQLQHIAAGGGWADYAHGKVPKSLCTKCGQWVQYPHDPETRTVICWLCVAKEALADENKKPETPYTKPKEGKSNGKRTSIPKRAKAGRRNSRA